MSQRGGRQKNHLVDKNFKYIITEGLKNPQHQCIHCGHQLTRNAAKGQQHLNQCDAYQKEKARKQKGILSNASIQLPITTLIRPLNQAQIALAHRAAAMSVYMTNLPFNHFENSYVIAYIRHLIRAINLLILALLLASCWTKSMASLNRKLSRN